MSNEDFKAAFLTAIRAGGAERERAFSFFETKLADSFKGEPGIQFFMDFMALVKEAEPTAVDQARERFYPLIDEKALQARIMGEFKDAVPDFIEGKVAAMKRKETLANFLEGADACTDEELTSFITRSIDAMEADHLVYLVEFLFRAVQQKKPG